MLRKSVVEEGFHVAMKNNTKSFVLGLGRWYSDQSTCHTSGGIRILILLIPQTAGEGPIMRFRGQTNFTCLGKLKLARFRRAPL